MLLTENDTKVSLEDYFLEFRKGIIGVDAKIPTVQSGDKTILYADWTASGRNYSPIEHRLQNEIMPYVANTHTETSATGMAMTHAYYSAQQIIKKHVNASDQDAIITAGSGMTRLVNKLQRILNLRGLHYDIKGEDKPVVFITHMEHHSNHTSWLETNAIVEVVPPSEDGLVDLENFERLIAKYKDHSYKIASITACSNVTGIRTPYHEVAKLIHAAGGYCFVDFACSAPYVDIDMHPEDKEAYLDAIIFSPHKFLGGPGSAGVLVFNKKLYNKEIPDNPGGGTVDWTNPWGNHKYVDDIEVREDGGTPAFLQTMKTAMSIKLKEEMGVDKMLKREHELLSLFWKEIEGVENINVLAPNHKNRLSIVSFYIDDLHYNLCVRMLNDRYGIQSRGGCSCAGTYGHYLLNVDEEQSKQITDLIDSGDFSMKPGWVRVSFHPTMTDEEVILVGKAIKDVAQNHKEWSVDYVLDPACTGGTSPKENVDARLKQKMNNAFLRSFRNE